MGKRMPKRKKAATMNWGPKDDSIKAIDFQKIRKINTRTLR